MSKDKSFFKMKGPNRIIKDTKTRCVPQKIQNRKVPRAILNKFDLRSNTEEFLPRKCLVHVLENRESVTVSAQVYAN